jgi:hypothetical protein
LVERIASLFATLADEVGPLDRERSHGAHEGSR